jgi:hypothetical protein
VSTPAALTVSVARSALRPAVLNGLDALKQNDLIPYRSTWLATSAPGPSTSEPGPAPLALPEWLHPSATPSAVPHDHRTARAGGRE